MSKLFYVYALFRPNGDVCYIGKGKGSRWRYSAFGRGTNRRLKKLAAESGGMSRVAFVNQRFTEQEAFAFEKKLIACFGRQPNGMLINIGEGGEGVSGPKSDAHRARIRENHWNKKTHPEIATTIGVKLQGRPKSKEHKEALKKAERPHLKGPITEKRRLAIQKSVLAFWERRRQEFGGLAPSLRGLSGHKKHSATMRARSARKS